MFTRLALVQRGNASWITTMVVNTTNSDLKIMSMNVLQQCRVILFLLFHFSLWNLFLLLLFRILIRFLFFGLLRSVSLLLFLTFQYFGLCTHLLWHRELKARGGCSGDV